MANRISRTLAMSGSTCCSPRSSAGCGPGTTSRPTPGRPSIGSQRGGHRLGLRRPVHSPDLAPVGSMRRAADAYVRAFNEQSVAADAGVYVTASFVTSASETG